MRASSGLTPICGAAGKGQEREESLFLDSDKASRWVSLCLGCHPSAFQVHFEDYGLASTLCLLRGRFRWGLGKSRHEKLANKGDGTSVGSQGEREYTDRSKCMDEKGEQLATSCFFPLFLLLFGRVASERRVYCSEAAMRDSFSKSVMSSIDNARLAH